MTAREDELRAEIHRLAGELHAAQEALTQEQFRDVPRLAAGTEVLVPRKLFGKARMWPAKIAGVHLRYTSGTDGRGEPWENKLVSYSVFLQQKDGKYGGSTVGYYANEVQLPPAQKVAAG
jgi:hypothetical protein